MRLFRRLFLVLGAAWRDCVTVVIVVVVVVVVLVVGIVRVHALRRRNAIFRLIFDAIVLDSLNKREKEREREREREREK